MVCSSTPLPKFQVAIVFLIQFTEPLAATVIFPFIKHFVDQTSVTGGNEKKNGYYVGLVESSFFLSECIVVMLWGMASDRFGRRPVLLLGPLGLAIATLSFGLSTRYLELILFRSLQGIFNGNIGVSKTVLVELSDSTNIAQIISWACPIWSMGVILGPAIGGVLSNPQEQFPSTLGSIYLLRAHPYFLPCAVVALVAFAIFFIALFGLKETHRVRWRLQTLSKKGRTTRSFGSPKKTSGNDPSSDSCLHSNCVAQNYGSIHKAPLTSVPPSSISNTPAHDSDLESGQGTTVASESHSDSYVGPSALKTIMIPEVLIPVCNYSLMTFLDSSYAVLIPLVYTTSVSAGGLGLTPFHVGIILACGGLANIPFPVLCVPRLIRRFGARNIHFYGLCAYLVGFSGLWGLSSMTKMIGYVNALVWTLLPLHFLLSYSIAALVYATSELFLINGAPSKSVLGTMNGFCQAAKTLARTLGPIIATSLFSLSKEHNICGGYMVYLIFLSITLVALRATMYLPKDLKRL